MKKGKFPVVLAIVSLALILAALPFISACAEPTPAPTQTPTQTTTPATVPAKPIELTFSTWTAVVSQDTEMCKSWMQEVEKRTQGRVKFTFYEAGALGAAKEHYDMAVKGLADLTYHNIANLPGRFLLADALQLPFTVPSAEVGAKVHVQLYHEFPEMQKEYSEVKVIGLGVIDPYFIITTKAAGQVRTLEDLKGKKIRTSGTEGDTIAALGGVPTGLLITEVYLALQKGVLDGASLGLSGLKAFKLSEVAHYLTYWDGSSIRVAPWIVPMNLAKWNSLPSDIQKIISELSVDGTWFAPFAGPIYTRWAEEGKTMAKEQGWEFYKLPPEELQRWMEKVKPMKEKWISDLEAKGLPGRKFIDRLVELSKQ